MSAGDAQLIVTPKDEREFVEFLTAQMNLYGDETLAHLEVARMVGEQVQKLSPLVPPRWKAALLNVLRHLIATAGHTDVCWYCGCREESACELEGGAPCAWHFTEARGDHYFGCCTHPSCLATFIAEGARA